MPLPGLVHFRLNSRDRYRGGDLQAVGEKRAPEECELTVQSRQFVKKVIDGQGVS